VSEQVLIALAMATSALCLAAFVAGMLAARRFTNAGLSTSGVLDLIERERSRAERDVESVSDYARGLAEDKRLEHDRTTQLLIRRIEVGEQRIDGLISTVVAMAPAATYHAPRLNSPSLMGPPPVSDSQSMTDEVELEIEELRAMAGVMAPHQPRHANPTDLAERIAGAAMSARMNGAHTET